MQKKSFQLSGSFASAKLQAKRFCLLAALASRTFRRSLLAAMFVFIVAGGAFAQKVGDTVTVSGKNFSVSEVRTDGSLVLLPVLSLDGVWQSSASGSTQVHTITGTTGVITQLGSGALAQDAASKGFMKVGDQSIRNLTKGSGLTWTGQHLGIYYFTRTPDVAEKVQWYNVTLTLSADGQTLQMTGGLTGSYTRRQ